MNGQLAVQDKKKGAVLPVGAFAQHAATRAIVDHTIESEPASALTGPRFEQDFSQVAVHAESVAARSELTPSCPLTPTRCPFGGACHTCPVQVQTKLAISQPGDEYEQEADRMADQLTRTPGAQLQRRAASPVEPTHAPPIVHDVLRSPGQPLDEATRASMEPRFGHDFSGVRVHTDAKAAESARAVNALAYTVGQDMVFGMGQCAPQSQEGRKLIAHELTHVAQQYCVGSRAAPRNQLSISTQSDSDETEAESIANTVFRDERDMRASTTIAPTLHSSDAMLHRVIMVRNLEQDDNTSREARRRIDETRRLLDDPNLMPPTRVELEARIREATNALQRYRRSLGSGVILGNPVVATTATADRTGIGVAIAMLFALAGALITGQALTRSGVAEELGHALGRLAETAERVRPMPLLRGEPEVLTEPETETRAAPGRGRQPSLEPEGTVDIFPPDIDTEEDRPRRCRAMAVGQRGGNTCHDEFAYLVSGVRREWGVETPEGLYAEFDAYGQDRVLYEIKTGYTFLLNTSPATYQMREKTIHHFVNQSQNQLEVATRCGYPLVWIFNNRQVADFVDGHIQPPVIWQPFPCDIDR